MWCLYCFELSVFKQKYFDHFAIHAYSFSYSNWDWQYCAGIKNKWLKFSTNIISLLLVAYFLNYFCIKITCMIIFKGWINQNYTNGAKYIRHDLYSSNSTRLYRLSGIYFFFFWFFFKHTDHSLLSLYAVTFNMHI